MQLGVEYLIEKLRPEHQTSKFSMGADITFRPLKTFIHKNALEIQTGNVAVTYAAVSAPTADTPR